MVVIVPSGASVAQFCDIDTSGETEKLWRLHHRGMGEMNPELSTCIDRGLEMSRSRRCAVQC